MRAVWLAGLLALTGCQGLGVGDDEFGERPVALQWFDAETLRRRAELTQEAIPGFEKMGPRGTANLDDIADYLSDALNLPDAVAAEEGDSSYATRMKRYPGRMALLDPGSGETALLPATPGALPRDWSNDGRQLLFSQLAGRFRQLFIYDREHETVHPVTHGPLVHVDGCFGPEGRLLLVASGVDDAGQVFSRLDMTAPGGSRPRPFTEGPSDFEVACAPDGSAVAWSRVDERGREQLVTRSPALDGPVRVLGHGRFPTFSPDSEWIVYSRPGRDGRWALQRIRADGSGRRPVGIGTRDEVMPTFSPDGRLVLYVSDNGYEQRIHVRRFDGSGDRLLTVSGGGTEPVW